MIRTATNDGSVTPLVSIIVPVYGVERYLDRCVESIVAQTYRNLEIILVDDGSPDQCPAMCDKWAGKDARVKVIHQANTGVSAARNNGLDKAKGEYLYFVDADDYTESDLIEIMVKRATTDEAQIVFCGYETNVLHDDGSYRKANQTSLFDITFTDNNAFIKRFAELAKERYIYPSWNKLFSTEFVRMVGSRFPVGVVADEDSYFNFPLYEAAKRVSVVPQALYHYVVRSGSAAGRYQPALFSSHKVVWEYVSPIVARWNPEFSSAFDNLFLSGVGLCLNFLYEDRSSQAKAMRRKVIRDIAHDSIVTQALQGFTPVNSRNSLTAKVLASHLPVLLALYGWTIAAVKRFINAQRKGR